MTVAACGMVKNEERIIARCLHSLRGLVQCVVVVVTGSTDDTLDLVGGLDFPGPIHVYQRPWQNFGHNLTESFRLASAHADYVLRVDADRTAEGSLPARLTADCCTLYRRRGTLAVALPLLVRSALAWRYEGVAHEYPTCDLPHTTGRHQDHPSSVQQEVLEEATDVARRRDEATPPPGTDDPAGRRTCRLRRERARRVPHDSQSRLRPQLWSRRKRRQRYF